MINKKKSDISVLGCIIWLLAAMYFMYEFFLRTFIGSMANQIIPSLGLDAVKFSILGSSYYLAYALMQIPVGVLTDKFGVKRTMVLATAVCGASTLLFSKSSNFDMALTARLLMGFGSSFAFVCLLIIANTWFPKRFFSFFSGLSQFIGTLGPLIAGGPLIAIMHHANTSWRQLLFYIGLFGFMLTISIFFIVRDKKDNHKRNFIFIRKVPPARTLIKTLFSSKQVWLVALFSASAYASLPLIGAIWGTSYLQTLQFTQTQAASIISITWLGYAIGCPSLGAISDLMCRRRPVLIFAAVVGLVSSILIIFIHKNQNYVFYSSCFFFLGVAGSGQNLGFPLITESVSSASRNISLGFNNFLITLSGAIIPPIASAFISLEAGSHPKHLVTHDFTAAFMLIPILFTLALILAAKFIRESYAKPQKTMIMLHSQ